MAKVLPGFVVFLEFVTDEGVETLGEVFAGVPGIFVLVEPEDSGGSGSVEIKFHKDIITQVNNRHANVVNSMVAYFCDFVKGWGGNRLTGVI